MGTPVLAMAMDDTFLYYATNRGLFRIDKTGGQHGTYAYFFALSGSLRPSIALDDTTVYFTVNEDQLDTHLYRIAKSAALTQVSQTTFVGPIWTAATPIATANEPTCCLTADATDLFWASASGIYRMPTSPGATSLRLASFDAGLPSTIQLAASDGGVYVWNRGAPAFLSHGTVGPIPSGEASPLLVAGGLAYTWGAGAGAVAGSIVAYPLVASSSGAYEPVNLSDPVERVALASDGKSVFWGGRWGGIAGGEVRSLPIGAIRASDGGVVPSPPPPASVVVAADPSIVPVDLPFLLVDDHAFYSVGVMLGMELILTAPRAQ
jgi:hypothetical protein